MAKIKALTQFLRLDGKNCFVEVMLNALPIDKVQINFVAYNANAAKGNRETGNISIYMGIHEARVLAGDILSGRLAADGKKKAAEAAAKSAETGKRCYPEPSFISLGGTPGKNTPDGKPISRQFRIAKGAAQPWVIEAMSGPGKTIGSGLIAPDGLPKTTIRVGLRDEQLKQLAFAFQTLYDLWARTKFAPVLEPMMAEVRAKTEADLQRISGAAENSAESAVEFNGFDEDEELPY